MTGDTDAAAAAIRREAALVLAPLADLAAPVAPGAQPPWDQLVRVREHDVRLASQCGASLAHQTDFDGWRAAFARRRIGRIVLERLRRGATMDAGSVARAVVDDAAREGRDGLGQWLSSLGPGGRAAVVREATTFAVAARAELSSSWPPKGARFDPPATFTWDVPGRAVRLEATADADACHDGERGMVRSVLVLASDEGDDASIRRDVAWLALVSTLATGRVTLRVTRVDLVAGGKRTWPVTDDVLDDGLTHGARAVEAAMAARYTDALPPTPGRWCHRCAGLTSCAAGATWVTPVCTSPI